MPAPTDRLYFHYSHFTNTSARSPSARLRRRTPGAFGDRSATTRGTRRLLSTRTASTDRSSHDSPEHRVVHIVVSNRPTMAAPGTRAANSLQQLVTMLRQDALKPDFEGVFVIEDHSHATRSGTLPAGGHIAPSQVLVIVAGATATPRLPLRASAAARELQDTLISSGFARACYVEIGPGGRLRN